MKKKIIALMITVATTMTFPVTAFASDNTLPDPGVTPDSIFYSIDKLGENIHLAFTSDPQKKATLLKSYAEERLAESKDMKDKKKSDLVKKTLNDYSDTIKNVTDQLDKAQSSGEDVSETVDDIDKTLKSDQEAVQDIASNLTTDVKDGVTSQIAETTGELGILKDTNDVLKQGIKDGASQSERKATELKTLTSYVGDQSFMDKATQDGLNARQIVTLKTLADQTGKTLEDVLSVFESNNKDMGATLKALSVKPQEIYKNINTNFKDVKKDINTEFKDDKQQSGNSEEHSAKKGGEATAKEQSNSTETKPEQNSQGKSEEHKSQAPVSEKVSTESTQQSEPKKDTKEPNKNANSNASNKEHGNGKK